MRDRMGRLLKGPKQYGEFYDRDLRIDAVMMRYSSPYPGVRAVADPIDDQNVPIETIRAYFLGISVSTMTTTMSRRHDKLTSQVCGHREVQVEQLELRTFKLTPTRDLRQHLLQQSVPVNQSVDRSVSPHPVCLQLSYSPSTGLSGSVIQILLFPCAKFLEYTLPDWGVTVFGSRHSLNPGPWTFKEQMFATITFNIAIYTTNSYGMVGPSECGFAKCETLTSKQILVQKLDLFYGLKFVNFGYQLMLTLFVQLMGRVPVSLIHLIEKLQNADSVLTGMGFAG